MGNFLGKLFSRKQARHLREVCFCPAALGLRAEREEPAGRAHVKFSSGLRSFGIFAVGCYSILDLMLLPDSEKPLEYGFVNVAHMKGGARVPLSHDDLASCYSMCAASKSEGGGDGTDHH